MFVDNVTTIETNLRLLTMESIVWSTPIENVLGWKGLLKNVRPS